MKSAECNVENIFRVSHFFDLFEMKQETLCFVTIAMIWATLASL